MDNKRSSFQVGITDILSIVVSCFFAVGIRVIFPVCELQGEMIMACHWAGEALSAMSLVLVLLSVIRLFVPSAVRSGISISCAVCAVYMLRLPGGIIAICGNSDMRCHITQAWTVGISAAVIAVSAADLLYRRWKRTEEMHRRPDIL